MVPLVFAGIDFMINLHGCIAVFEKKKVGMLEEAGKELMVNGFSRHLNKSQILGLPEL